MPSGGDDDDSDGDEVGLGLPHVKTDFRVTLDINSFEKSSQVAPNLGRSGLASLIGRDKGNPYEASSWCSQVEGWLGHLAKQPQREC